MLEELVIEPGRSERNYWRDLWRYRELMYFLAYRDILVRYKQTAIGVIWVLLKPALTMGVFVAFRRMTQLSDSDVPDSLLVYSALLPWQLFSSALTESSGSLVANSNLISKVYFPRLLVPASSVLASLVDFAVTAALMVILMGWYGVMPRWELFAFPFLVALTFALSFGSGLLLAALNVKYRDFRYIVPFVVQFGLFVSPIAVETSRVPPSWSFALRLNPMTGIIDGFRWSLLGGRTTLDSVALGSSVAVTLAFLLLGIWYFRRTERGFADVI